MKAHVIVQQFDRTNTPLTPTTPCETGVWHIVGVMLQFESGHFSFIPTQNFASIGMLAVSERDLVRFKFAFQVWYTVGTRGSMNFLVVGNEFRHSPFGGFVFPKDPACAFWYTMGLCEGMGVNALADPKDVLGNMQWGDELGVASE